MSCIFRTRQFLRSTVRSHNTLPTYHKRELPSSLIALSSLQGTFIIRSFIHSHSHSHSHSLIYYSGRLLFKESLDQGGMESYFALSEQFVTQSEPSFCALSSLAMVLNALSYDPKKIWKGPWRWVIDFLSLFISYSLSY